jgi:hypothetical protein
VCWGTLVYSAQTVREGVARPGQGGGCGECVRVYWIALRKLSGNEWPGQARQENVASVNGYTGTLRAHTDSGRTITDVAGEADVIG